MKIVKYPSKEEWTSYCVRPQIDYASMDSWLEYVFQLVKNGGDEALLKLTEDYDKVSLTKIQMKADSLESLAQQVNETVKTAIDQAYQNIYDFHRLFVPEDKRWEQNGVACWKKFLPIDTVGLYIPGGSAPLFSSLMMQIIPAQLAGCKDIVVCTPPNQKGEIAPELAYILKKAGINLIFTLGGAQAIAAMTFGTSSVPKVNKLFGPGNQYVAAAKVKAQSYGVAMDMFAGPSEVLVIADATALPKVVASDLLAQAEHAPDTQVVLLTDSETLLQEVEQSIPELVAKNGRKKVLDQSLLNANLILLEDIAACVDFSNLYAPEHLMINVKEAANWCDQITNAGSVFVGSWSTEAFGDYNSGTNHALPTGGWTKTSSGLSVTDFCKAISFQEVSQSGFNSLSQGAKCLANQEGLPGHAMSVEIREQLMN